MSVVPKPPPWDAKSAKNAWAALRKPDGSPYSVFQNAAYVDFVNWVRGQRDHLEALRVGVFGAGGIKSDVDNHTERLNQQAARITALENAPAVPFPGSG
jgi:hypothetical protein